HSLTVFGVGTELRDTEWRGVVRQLLAQRLLAVEGDYGTLALTEHSGAVLRRERQVALRKDPERVKKAVKKTKEQAQVDLPPEAAGLFERLRAWRAGVAREQGIPAYVVFHDATLRQIASDRPTSLSALSAVNGVGQSKLDKYGEQVLATIADEPT